MTRVLARTLFGRGSLAESIQADTAVVQRLTEALRNLTASAGRTPVTEPRGNER